MRIPHFRVRFCHSVSSPVRFEIRGQGIPPHSSLFVSKNSLKERVQDPKQKDVATQLVDLHNLAVRYGVSARTISRWRRCRLLPFIKIGYRTYLFDVDQCDAALRRLEIQPRWLKI